MDRRRYRGQSASCAGGGTGVTGGITRRLFSNPGGYIRNAADWVLFMGDKQIFRIKRMPGEKRHPFVSPL
ncbi:MAG: hypothetical protein K6U80_04790 [Firmicutes bacterium]|nr:hypothetical protein [Bacillota bacterium]